MEAHRVVRHRDSHIFYTIGSQMAVRLSALRAGCPLHPGIFLVLISFRGWVDRRAIVKLEGLGQLKNPVTSSVIETTTFRLVAQCLNQLRYLVPPTTCIFGNCGNCRVHVSLYIILQSRNITHPDRANVEVTKSVPPVAIYFFRNLPFYNCYMYVGMWRQVMFIEVNTNINFKHTLPPLIDVN
jgi:hypothetical protein